MYRFWRFGLKLPIHAPFGRFWGIFSPYDVTHRPDPQKDRPWRKHAIQRENWCDGSTWARDEEKNTRQQRSHKSVIFPLFGGKPPLDRFDPKVA